jgi:hypothetical protein
MTIRTALLTSVIALASTTATAQTTGAPPDQPIIYSGIFNIGPDGRARGFAAQTGERAGADLAGILYTTPCSGMGASNPGRPLSAFATDAWLMSGTVLELIDQGASVQVGWRRVRRDGRQESTPEQSLTVTLKRGERYTLESVAFPASGSCEARNVSLDIVYASSRELTGMPASVHGFAGSRGSAGAGSHAAPGTGSGGGGGAHVLRQASSSGTADLWLVRSTPGRADETLHTVAQITPIPVTFAFAPLTIQSAGGTVSVKVEGTLETGRTSDGERRLHFTATRSVTALTTARPAPDSKPLVEGSTKTTVTFPGPDEVLSFDMPPLRAPDGSTPPDRLSIRLQITPSPKR